MAFRTIACDACGNDFTGTMDMRRAVRVYCPDCLKLPVQKREDMVRARLEAQWDEAGLEPIDKPPAPVTVRKATAAELKRASGCPLCNPALKTGELHDECVKGVAAQCAAQGCSSIVKPDGAVWRSRSLYCSQRCASGRPKTEAVRVLEESAKVAKAPEIELPKTPRRSSPMALRLAPAITAYLEQHGPTPKFAVAMALDIPRGSITNVCRMLLDRGVIRCDGPGQPIYLEGQTPPVKPPTASRASQPYRDRILAWLKENGPARRREIAEGIGKKPTQLRQAIPRLMENDLLLSTGGYNSIYYLPGQEMALAQVRAKERLPSPWLPNMDYGMTPEELQLNGLANGPAGDAGTITVVQESPNERYARLLMDQLDKEWSQDVADRLERVLDSMGRGPELTTVEGE